MINNNMIFLQNRHALAVQCTRINFTFRGVNIIIYSFLEHNILHLLDIQHMNTCQEISNG